MSLAIMLADAVVSLGFLLLQTLWRRQTPRKRMPRTTGSPFWRRLIPGSAQRAPGYVALRADDHDAASESHSGTGGRGDVESPPRERASGGGENEPLDAPPEQQVGNWTVCLGLVLSIILCIGTVHAVFGSLVPLYANVLAVLLALLLSIMGVRALGETDLNPVSGISKLAQLFFAVIIPQGHKASVLINLVAGAVVSPCPSTNSCSLRGLTS